MKQTLTRLAALVLTLLVCFACAALAENAPNVLTTEEYAEVVSLGDMMRAAPPLDISFLKGQKWEVDNGVAEKGNHHTQSGYKFAISGDLNNKNVLCAKQANNTETGILDFATDSGSIKSKGHYELKVVENKDNGTRDFVYDKSVYNVTLDVDEVDGKLAVTHYTVSRDGIQIAEGNSVEDWEAQQKFDVPYSTGTVFHFYNVRGKRAVSATKAWDDEENIDDIRPNAVTVQLYKHTESNPTPQAVGQPVQLTAANGWTHTWTNLDLFEGRDAELIYTVQEVGQIPGYAAPVITGTMLTGFTITNTHVPKKLNLTVSKAWNDSDNADGLRPDSVTVRITGTKADGTVIVTDSIALSAANSWQYTFEQLQATYQNEDLVWTVTEESVPEYIGVVGEPAVDEEGNRIYTITNTHVASTDVTIRKNVTGGFADPTRPFAFTAVVRDAEGSTITGLTDLPGNCTVNADGTLSFSLAHNQSITLPLPVGMYLTLTEETVEGYTTTYTAKDGAAIEIPALIPEDGLDITVTNHMEDPVITGISLDGAPYLLLLALSAVGLMTLLRKRREA